MLCPEPRGGVHELERSQTSSLYYNYGTGILYKFNYVRVVIVCKAVVSLRMLYLVPRGVKYILE